MNAATSALDRWAAAAERCAFECEQAEVLLVETGDPRALEHVTRARQTAWATYRSLLEAGAAPVDDAGVPAQVPLHLLDTPHTRRLLDTPHTRRLLDALRCAADAAGAVDRERGWTLTNGTPCGLSETIGDIAERLRIEVEGPCNPRGE